MNSQLKEIEQILEKIKEDIKSGKCEIIDCDAHIIDDFRYFNKIKKCFHLVYYFEVPLIANRAS